VAATVAAAAAATVIIVVVLSPAVYFGERALFSSLFFLSKLSKTTWIFSFSGVSFYNYGDAMC